MYIDIYIYIYIYIGSGKDLPQGTRNEIQERWAWGGGVGGWGSSQWLGGTLTFPIWSHATTHARKVRTQSSKFRKPMNLPPQGTLVVQSIHKWSLRNELLTVTHCFHFSMSSAFLIWSWGVTFRSTWCASLSWQLTRCPNAQATMKTNNRMRSLTNWANPCLRPDY